MIRDAYRSLSASIRAALPHPKREQMARDRAAFDHEISAIDPGVLAFTVRPTLRAAALITGNLGNPSKMPGKAIGIPASQCGVGRKLALIADSVCSECYAYGRGRYGAYDVLMGQWRRFHALTAALASVAVGDRWVEAMTLQLREREAWFRWHDSGDLQSRQHLDLIVRVARATPDTGHWIPTKETGMVLRYLLDGGTIPANLTIRVSAPMCGGALGRIVAAKLLDYGITTSTVDNGSGSRCPAPSQGGRCDDCRACWDRTVPNVDYHIH